MTAPLGEEIAAAAPADAAASAAAPSRLVVAVRTLCAFTAKSGDLDLRFTPAPTALEGIAAHTLVTARRGTGYEKEVSLTGCHAELEIRGRADGYDAVRNRLEEIKTVRGDPARVPSNQRRLHWAQARIYGWLLCHQRGLTELELALVYYDIESGRETLFCESWQVDALQQFFTTQCEQFLAWARHERAHRQDRDAALKAMRFPFADFRPGQRELAESVFKAISTGRCLLAQAPTGIGKTLATLFPVLKAMPAQRLDKVYYLAAKTPGRQLALDGLAALTGANQAVPLRVVELTARDKACEHPDKACHGDSCPLARGFYDRLAAAREAAASAGRLDRERLREIALAHQLCPYFLAQEMVRWSDVVVGDYNYYFDSSALLFAAQRSEEWRVAVLVDEVHNLVERARDMYSAELDQSRLLAARRIAPPTVRRALDAVQRCWRELNDGQTQRYQVCAELPSRWVKVTERASAALAEQLAEEPLGVAPELLQLHFELLRFNRLAEQFGPHSLFDSTLQRPQAGHTRTTLCLRNVVPASFLTERFRAARSVTLFSATLAPAHFQRDLLGLPEETVWLDVASPFVAKQLDVQLVGDISTRYRDRAASLQPIVALIAAQFVRQPGNYLAFFSSFDYLQQAETLLREHYPELPLWPQQRGMTEQERSRFLERFTPASQGVGLVVLGGAFGEGVDLPGERLIGAFVATLGLPQLNPVNEQRRQRLDQLFGAGYDYAYLYPGLQKVVQAAGRVIRDERDRGVLYLLDDRYTEPRIRALLPDWWAPRVVSARQQGG